MNPRPDFIVRHMDIRPPRGEEMEPYFSNQRFEKPKGGHSRETDSGAQGLKNVQSPWVDVPASFLKLVIYGEKKDICILCCLRWVFDKDA